MPIVDALHVFDHIAVDIYVLIAADRLLGVPSICKSCCHWPRPFLLCFMIMQVRLYNDGFIVKVIVRLNVQVVFTRRMIHGRRSIDRAFGWLGSLEFAGYLTSSIGYHAIIKGLVQ